ncbi:MAG: hypothetical protein QOG87_3877 [Actinomycetota bacterium]|jgi:ATP-dependent Clp protease ATP-binding subunit ClpA
MWDKFSDGARRALTWAKAEAAARDSGEITLVHILVGLCRSDSGATEVLSSHGVTLDSAIRLLPATDVDPASLDPEPIPFSDAAKRLLVEAVRSAVTEDGLEGIVSRDLLRALAKSESPELVTPLAEAGLKLPT